MSQPAGTSGKTTGVNSEVNWSELVPISYDYEDSVGAEKVREIWSTMYSLAGLKAPSEDIQRAFRLAVYAYAAVNGTSREGNYAGNVTMANGHKFNASIIVRATTKTMIRKFFRGNMKESYEALKNSGVIAKDERMVVRAAQYGAPPDIAFALADWFTNCPFFTPLEKKLHDESFAFSITRARRGRGGDELEVVEQQRLERNLDAQGSEHVNSGGKISF